MFAFFSCVFLARQLLQTVPSITVNAMNLCCSVVQMVSAQKRATNSQCGTGECCNSSNGVCTTNCIHDNITGKMTTEDIAGTALAAPQGSSPSLVSSLTVPGHLLNDRHRHPGAVSVVGASSNQLLSTTQTPCPPPQA